MENSTHLIKVLNFVEVYLKTNRGKTGAQANQPELINGDVGRGHGDEIALVNLSSARRRYEPESPQKY